MDASLWVGQENGELFHMSLPTDIDTPEKAIAYLNARIRKLEEIGETAKMDAEKPDLTARERQMALATASRCQGHIIKLMDILQHYMRQDWQQGGGPEDISKALSNKGKKSRVNG